MPPPVSVHKMYKRGISLVRSQILSSGWVEKGERKGLVNNLTLTGQIHGCIPAISVDDGKCERQVGVSRE